MGLRVKLDGLVAGIVAGHVALPYCKIFESCQAILLQKQILKNTVNCFLFWKLHFKEPNEISQLLFKWQFH